MLALQGCHRQRVAQGEIHFGLNVSRDFQNKGVRLILNLVSQSFVLFPEK